PHHTSPALAHVMQSVRAEVPHYDLDRYFAPDIEAIARLVQNGAIASHSPLAFESEAQ
ncbi:histidine ammonia-lyase, partial [Paraburkholderia sp. BR10872]